MRSSVVLSRAVLVALLFLLLFLSLPSSSSAQRKKVSRKTSPAADDRSSPVLNANAPIPAPAEAAGVDAAPADPALEAMVRKRAASRTKGPSPKTVGKLGGRGGGGGAGDADVSAPSPAASPAGDAVVKAKGGGFGNGWLKDIPEEVLQPYLLNIGTAKLQSDVLQDDVVQRNYQPVDADDHLPPEGAVLPDIADFYIWRKPAEGETTASPRSITSAPPAHTSSARVRRMRRTRTLTYCHRVPSCPRSIQRPVLFVEDDSVGITRSPPAVRR